MSFINKSPVGWLGFLGIKNFGRNPSQVAEVLAPTWDLSELYLSAQRVTVITSGTINGVGTYPAFTPPAGRVWYVAAFSVTTNALNAANVVNCVPMIYNSALGYEHAIGNGLPSVVTGANPGTRVVFGIERPLILQSGESIGFYCSEFVAPNLAYVVRMLYTVLQA